MDSERCGAVTGEPYAFEVECCLRKGHLGDHYAVASWPQYEPRQPSGPPPQWLTDTWAKMIEIGLRPVVARDRVVNRDTLTCHHEPHPELPGVVMPVLDQAVRMDPATGAVEWD